MSRFDRRASRPLFVVLALLVLLAGFSIYHNMAKDSGPKVALAPSPKPATNPSEPAPARPHDSIAGNPATHPASRPSSIVRTPLPLAQPAATRTPTTAPSVLDTIADARAKVDAGNLIEARAQLNDALQAGTLSETDTAAAKTIMADISKAVIFSRQHFAGDPYCVAYVVKSGDALAKIATSNDCTWELLSRINGVDAPHLRAGATIKVVQGPFFAVVDKKKFTMDLYLGGLPGEKSSMYVMTYPVGLGKDDSTPPGTWMIEPHHKLKHPTYYSPRGEGVIPADDPKNPLGGFWIGLTGTDGQAVGRLSYGIHGTIEPDSIGKQSSMGCIRMRNEDVAVVYELLVEGKSMVIVKE